MPDRAGKGRGKNASKALPLSRVGACWPGTGGLPGWTDLKLLCWRQGKRSGGRDTPNKA